MNSFILKSFVFIECLFMCRGSVVLYPAVINPEYPDSCWDESSNQPVAIGGLFPGPDCTQATCTGSGGKLFMELAECLFVEVPKGCTTTSNPSLPYPQCCETPKCPSANKIP